MWLVASDLCGHVRVFVKETWLYFGRTGITVHLTVHPVMSNCVYLLYPEGHYDTRYWLSADCSGSAGASVVAHSVALPLIEIAFSTLDCSIVPTCGAWGSATAAKRGPLKQSWAVIQHSRDGEPLGVLMQMRNVRVNGFFFFSSLGVLPGVLVDTPSLCCGNFCVECLLIVLHKFYIQLYKKYNWLDPGPSMRFDEIIILFCNKCR